MKVVKFMLAVNGVTLVINGIIVWLMVVKAFPPVLGIMLGIGCLGGLIWLSSKANGRHFR